MRCCIRVKMQIFAGQLFSLFSCFIKVMAKIMNVCKYISCVCRAMGGKLNSTQIINKLI